MEFLFLFVIAGIIYFIPTMVASANERRNIGAIFALNLFLGWTLVGWVLALVWSLCKDEEIGKKSIDANEEKINEEDIATQIEKLASLKEKNIISYEEFKAKKKELLDRL